MEFRISNFKSFRGREGMGFNATLHVDGQKACEIDDAANGGEFDYRWFSEATRLAVQAHVDALPLIPSVDDDEKSLWPNGRKQDMDGFISQLVDAYETERMFRRACKTKTVFRLATDPPDEYRTLKAPYEPRGREWLASHYPTGVAEVLNLKFL